ncbi:SPFH domain-containing protein [Spiractinospora alimapuensis]|uniref:SPFH domain-containing protein n=1 Tax=Spiractinospora alimapuensis TaxID=2820884 RepID=UPI001F18B2F0|nr:SPFH domain-containing protein [Spiractinospora alimapuensis]QVQ50087.1 SPFH domain-containing protein [Spiractinospora alimapuensis]
MAEPTPSETPSTDALEPTLREYPARSVSGWGPLLLAAVLILGGLLVGTWGVLQLTGDGPLGLVMLVGGIVALLVGLVLAMGLTAVAPKEAQVIQVLGKYVGTVRTDGLQWVNPLSYPRQKVSVRIRNHETSTLKVNDLSGNPIEIAAVVVWQVTDTAEATFGVDDFVQFVNTQSETAVRHIANGYAYDVAEGEGLTLRDNADEITEKLTREIADRVDAAGVRVIESRITHLAYAPEIAGAMLRRQQAGAVVAARQQIVEGSVGMVEMALNRLAEDDVVDLDEERKAAMVSNLLVVLCADRDAQPVVNSGSLYQ